MNTLAYNRAVLRAMWDPKLACKCLALKNAQDNPLIVTAKFYSTDPG